MRNRFKQEIEEILSDFAPSEEIKIQPWIMYKHKKIEVLQGISYREECQTREDYLNLDYHKMYKFYKDYLTNPKHFHFVFSGNFEPHHLKDSIAKYIGNIPAQECDKNLTGLRFNILQVKKDTTVIVKEYPGKGTFVEHCIQKKFTPTIRKKYALKIIVEILKRQFRKEFRENKNWVYNITTQIDIKTLPYPYFRLNISYLISDQNLNQSAVLTKKIIRQFDFTSKELTDAKTHAIASERKRDHILDEKIKNAVLENSGFHNREQVITLIEKMKKKYIQEIYQKYLSNVAFITFQFKQ